MEGLEITEIIEFQNCVVGHEKDGEDNHVLVIINPISGRMYRLKMDKDAAAKLVGNFTSGIVIADEMPGNRSGDPKSN